MQRKNIIKKIITTIKDDSYIIVFGKDLCKEAYQYDCDKILYINNYNNLSVAVGVALSVPSYIKIYALFDDSTMLNHMDSIFQTFLLKPTNLFLIFMYDTTGIFTKVSHVQGIFFNIGLQSFKVADYFDKKLGVESLKGVLSMTPGPKVFLVPSDVSKRSTTVEIDKSSVFFRDRFNYKLNKDLEDK